MAASKGMEWGWMFLRIGLGVHWSILGAGAMSGGRINITDLAYLVAGVLTALGLLVRPGALFLLCVTLWFTFSEHGMNIHMSYTSLLELLSVIGILCGGGGMMLAVGAMISGMSGKWWQ